MVSKREILTATLGGRRRCLERRDLRRPFRRAPITVNREDIDNRQVDFTDIATGRRLPTVHPGDILLDAFLKPMGLSVYTLAIAIKIPRSRANDVVRGRRAVTTDTALRLGRYFGTTAAFWINLQAHYDTDVADCGLRATIEREVKSRTA